MVPEVELGMVPEEKAEQVFEREPVVAALRLLRRRIARLEDERESALEEAARLRVDVEMFHDELSRLDAADDDVYGDTADDARRQHAGGLATAALASDIQVVRREAEAMEKQAVAVRRRLAAVLGRRRALTERADKAEAAVDSRNTAIHAARQRRRAEAEAGHLRTDRTYETARRRDLHLALNQLFGEVSDLLRTTRLRSSSPPRHQRQQRTAKLHCVPCHTARSPPPAPVIVLSPPRRPFRETSPLDDEYY